MSKLRSQLNNLKADLYQSRQYEAHHNGENIGQHSENHSGENHQKLAEIKSAIEKLTGKISSTKNNSSDGAIPGIATSTPAQPSASVIDTEIFAENVARSVSQNLRLELNGEIDKMRQELGSLQSNADDSSDRAVLNDINLISQGIQDLQSHQAANTEHFGEIAGELREIHQNVRSFSEHDPQATDNQNITDTVQLAYDEIAAKLDSLGSSEIGNHILTLSEKLETIKENIVSTDPETLLRIENQLQSLGERITALVNDGMAVSDDAHDTLLPEYFENIERKLDEIARAVVASTPIESDPSGDEAYERIEARINSLAKSFDNISIDALQSTENPQMPEQLQETLSRLEQQITRVADSPITNEAQIDSDFGIQLASLSQKIDHIYSGSTDQSETSPFHDELGQKLDSLSLTLERAINSGDGSVNQLESQISDLSNRIDQAVGAEQDELQSREQNDSRIVEELQSISARVESMEPGQINTESHNSQLSALEEQMSAIATQLESIGEQQDLNAIEARLGGIEEQFATNRETASKSATVSDDEIHSPMISMLADDLKSLSQSSFELKGHSLETFNAVRDSLAMILDRINSIEARMANDEPSANNSHPQPAPDHELHNADMVNAAREYASSLTKYEAQHEVQGHENEVSSDDLLHHEKTPNELNLPGVDVASLDLQHLPEVENPPVPADKIADDDIPLEPGSGAPQIEKNAPNMDALVQQAKENRRKETLEDEQQNPTDFIAAARRAAQAAANEANSITDVADKEPKSGNFSLKKILASRKKVVLLSAAAIILALLAVPASQYLRIPATKQLGKSNPIVQEQQPEQSNPVVDTQKPEEHSQIQTIPEPVKQATTEVSSAKNPQDNQSLEAVRPVSEQSKPEIDKARNISSEQPDVLSVKNPPAVTDNKQDTALLPETTPKTVEVVEIPMPPKELGPIALRQAAANGDPTALFEVGRRYTQGLEGTPNFTEAVKWYRLAAKSNHAPAQYRLGNFNEKGHGITRDVNKAADWYKRSAEQGNALAMHNLAVVNAMGVLDGGTNMKEASVWFNKAAEHGVKDSQVNLGIIYAKAMGVEADLAKAYKWFAIAARAGDKDAAQKRDTVAKQLKADQLKAARGEVELWRPQELNKETNSVEIPAEWKVAPQVTASLTNKQMILKAQTILTKLGFNPGSTDGVMGTKTINAIKEFQTRAGISVNREVTPDLLSALEKSSS